MSQWDIDTGHWKGFFLIISIVIVNPFPVLFVGTIKQGNNKFKRGIKMEIKRTVFIILDPDNNPLEVCSTPEWAVIRIKAIRSDRKRFSFDLSLLVTIEQREMTNKQIDELKFNISGIKEFMNN